MISIILSSCLIIGGMSHGRLMFPTTRYGVKYGSGAYENNPTGGAQSTDFVCRNEPGAVPAENTFTAGKQMNVQWGLSAAHVGDCALYISYDYDKTGEDKRNMKFFKIAQWQRCKDINNVDNAITLPDWVPAGRAVFRWDWVALHVWPTLEMYTQCADAQIVSSSGSLPQDIPSYPAVGLYPADGSNGGFRNPYGGGAFFTTGSPCACINSPDNGCPIVSDPSAAGYISVATMTECGGGNGGNPNPSPTQRPTEQRLQTDPPTISSDPSDGSCPTECTTCQTWGADLCTDWCSKWGYCGYTNDHIVDGIDCRGCGGNPVPSPTPAPVANPTPAPVPNPTPAPVADPTPAPVENPTEASCASGNDLESRSGSFNKRVKTECECKETCGQDSDNAIYVYLENKEQCLCISS